MMIEGLKDPGTLPEKAKNLDTVPEKIGENRTRFRERYKIQA